MDRIRTAARTYPLVATTLAVGLLGGVVTVAGFPDGTRWLLSLYALVIAAVQDTTMPKRPDGKSESLQFTFSMREEDSG